MITSRPATRADVAHYYPDIKASFRAWVCELDGQLAGIIGITLTVPAALFSAFDECLRPHLNSLTIMRCIKWAADTVKCWPCMVLAVAQQDEVTAPYILQRMGFRYHDTVEGEDIYRWGSE